MIFDNNTTSLGSMNIPMAEGYDGNIGVALALIESARNDYSMFKGLLAVDAKELAINNESAGFVNESEVIALKEASVKGIVDKIKQLFTKLIAKIKSIFHTLISKLNALYMKDKDLVKKYEKELYRKTNLGNMEIKWRKVKTSPTDCTLTSNISKFDETDAVSKYSTDSVERFKHYAGCEEVDVLETATDTCFEDEDTIKLSEANCGGIRGICSFLSGYSAGLKKITRANNEQVKNIENTIKELDRNYNSNYKTMDGNAVGDFNKKYDMAVSYQSALLKTIAAQNECIKIEYKQYKAAFMKAVAANDKKLEESAVIADAFAEAAANEVEDVISAALTTEQISKICNASKNVLDAGVSDDPSKLTYGKDRYTTDRSTVSTEGKKCSSVKGTCESSIFDAIEYV